MWYDYLKELFPYLVQLSVNIILAVIMLVRTSASSLNKKLGGTTSFSNYNPDDYLICYEDKVVPFSSVKLVKKSDFAFTKLMEVNFNEKTNEKKS